MRTLSPATTFNRARRRIGNRVAYVAKGAPSGDLLAALGEATDWADVLATLNATETDWRSLLARASTTGAEPEELLPLVFGLRVLREERAAVRKLAATGRPDDGPGPVLRTAVSLRAKVRDGVNALPGASVSRETAAERREARDE